MKKPSAEKIERLVSKQRSRLMKANRRQEAEGVEPLLLLGIAAFAFAIGLMIGGLLAVVLL